MVRIGCYSCLHHDMSSGDVVVVVVRCVVFAIVTMCCVVGFLHLGGKHWIEASDVVDKVVLLWCCCYMDCVMA